MSYNFVPLYAVNFKIYILADVTLDLLNPKSLGLYTVSRTMVISFMSSQLDMK